MQSKTTPYTLTDGATVAVDWNNSVNQQVTMAGNRTFTFSNPVAGSFYTLKIIQDSTGSRTATFPAAVEWAGGSAPTLTTTASRVDIITFYYDGVNYFDVSIKKDYTI
jgi:hypothetical protein